MKRSFYADYLHRVRGNHQTAAFEKTMNKRPVWVEPLFGAAKDWHGLGRFRLRGLWKVNAVALESEGPTVWLGLFQLEEKRDNVG